MMGRFGGEISLTDMFSPFDTLPECHKRTDRQTDKQDCYSNIARTLVNGRERTTKQVL